MTTTSTRSRTGVMAVTIALSGLLLTGCLGFQIRGFTVQPKALSPGGTATVKVNLFKFHPEIDTAAHAFLLIGTDTLDVGRVSRFDMQRNHGGRYPRAKNDQLRDVLLTGTNCSFGGVSAAAIEGNFGQWGAWHTVAKVDPTASADNRVFRVRLELDRPGGTSDGDLGSVVIFSGAWTDANGDGVAQAAEVVCNGVVIVSIPFKP